MKLFSTCFLFVIFMSLAEAQETSGGCKGTYQGKNIVFSGLLDEGTDDGRGSITIDETVVADFEKDDLKINYFMQSFKAVNNQGAVVEGRVTDFFKKTGIITRLLVPAFGIDYRNIPMACWSAKK